MDLHEADSSGKPASGPDEEVAPKTVLDALGDSACRAILREINDPMTAKEISAATDLPLSTTYRKLDFLSDTLLLRERTEVRPDGNHTQRYMPDFEAVRIVVDERRNIDVAIAPSKVSSGK
ncbi:MAG: helix-turn-helix domain-containing protein [Halobacteriales archaeon]